MWRPWRRPASGRTWRSPTSTSVIPASLAPAISAMIPRTTITSARPDRHCVATTRTTTTGARGTVPGEALDLQRLRAQSEVHHQRARAHAVPTARRGLLRQGARLPRDFRLRESPTEEKGVG